MKTLSYFLIGFVLLLQGAMLEAQLTGEKTVFWEISVPGSDLRSYLFGTMHILPAGDFIAYPVVDEKLKSAGTLVLEMDIDVPIKVQMDWAQKMLLPDEKLISDYVDSITFKRISSYALDTLAIKNFLFTTYIRLKPFAFYSALLPHAIDDKIQGYELYFSKMAGKKKIPVYGLETFDFQMGIFDSISPERQMHMFFDEMPDLRADMQEMIDIYNEQDIYAMARLIREESPEYQELEEQLLVMRNANWVSQLDSLMTSGPCFIAVGAAHLAGEHGLIGLLRLRGFTVEPVILKE